MVAYASLLLLAAGCGGINMRQSVSPATFLLPGLLKTEPQPAPAHRTLPDAAAAQEVALVR